MKNILGYMAAMMAMVHDVDIPSERGRNNLHPNDIDMTPPKKIIPKGCKVFNIGGVEIVAINEKSAIKKHRKKFGNVE